MLLNADTITLECGTATGSVCKGSRLKISCVADTNLGFLRWSSNTTEQISFTKQSPTGVPMMIHDVNYTLVKWHNATTEGRISFQSTAEFVATKDMTISCEDGENERETCEVQVISEYIQFIEMILNHAIVLSQLLYNNQTVTYILLSKLDISE